MAKKGSLVKLVEVETESKAMESVISAIIYEQSSGISFEKILQYVKKMSESRKKKIISEMANIRKK